MNASEQITIQDVSTLQAVMKEKQHNMQNDINELKKIAKDTNDQINLLNQKFDELAGAKKFLIWFTGVAISLVAVAVSLVHEIHKR